MAIIQLDNLISGTVTAAVGFLAAYALARRQRRWDIEDAAATARARLIQSVRVPLEIIRTEIRDNQAFYYNRLSQERIDRTLREAIYGLGDKQLIGEFEQAVLPLWELATGNDHKASGDKCRPKIDAMLTRLFAIEPTTATRPKGVKHGLF